MVRVLYAVEVVLGNYPERASITTEHTAIELNPQSIIFILGNESRFRTDDMEESTICKNDIEGLNIVDAETERMNEVSESTCLGMTSDVDVRTLAMRNRYLKLLEMF